MLKLSSVKINVHTTEYEDRFFITAENDKGELLPPKDWKGQLFLWHEESYYGTLLQEEDNGIPVTQWQFLTLLAGEHFSSMIQWDWDETGQACIAIAPVMYEALEEGRWLPRFGEWQETGLQFHIPDEVWGNFNDEFWEETLPDGGPSLKKLTENWFQGALNEAMASGGSHAMKRIQKLKDSTLTSEELDAYFDEKRWSEWIAGADEELPFSMGLRISEPLDEDESWELETILRDRKRTNRVVSLTEDTVPPSWKKHLGEVSEEQERWMKMLPILRDVDGSLRTSLGEHDAWDFLSVLSEKLIDLDIEILLPSWWEAMKDAQVLVKAKLKNTDTSYRPSFVGLNAMLDFDWRLSMNGVDLNEDDFNQLVNDQRRLVKIRGQWMKLDPAMIRRIQQMMTKAKQEGISIQDMLEQELVPRDSDESNVEEDDEGHDPFKYAKIQLELNRSMKKMIHQLTNVSSIPLTDTPADFQGELRPYQQLGMSWMLFLRKFNFGACLADDMGLGKTVQLITYLQHVKETEKPEAPSLIVAPTSVLGNWQRELEKFAPNLKVHLHYGPTRAKGADFAGVIKGVDVILTSYGLSHIDYDELSEVEWTSISLDEAQNIKNANTKQSRAIRKLTGKHHIALTGTPMENRLSELWSIFDFLNHGYLGGFTQYQKNYIAPIEKDESEEKVKELQAKIKPFLLRRTKKDPEVELNLPEKLEQKEYCHLTAEQAALYEQLVKDTLAQIETVSGFERKGLILQMLNQLKQLCNHPALYLKEPDPKSILSRSEKMQKLKDIVETALESGEACLIFTQYISMGEMIQDVMKKEFDIKVPFLNGSMAKGKRDELVDKFQKGEFPVFLLSLKAGGTGLNLTAANHVVHYDRWWNPAVENQATDRAYRIGQKRFVHVHKLVSSGTLEEKIDAMLTKKQALNDEIIRSDQWVTELSDQDLESLLVLE
ncbi:DEAD/DEAH box helicase [Bacillus sp. KH172YL63]|uniref:DEAD/DEAH box helicase n=1 Tax=Bacillus sp. KH172YL63 TaxID=2709784 RepID=UPI0013E42A6F|nr:DEAD/DEAH box helicase [Bacillus sp. KH172YL63]BCB05898.1 putative ATP-dependent helicase YwqA [Bacillus sp. KH172YL63]